MSSGLPRNPLPDAFIITPRDSTPRAMQDLAQHARTWPMVDTVQHDAAWSGRYHALLRFSRLGLLILAGILALALVAISFNTIRLQILSRQQEIDVAILIGATHPWIARPFLWFGLIEGLLGALFAILLLFGTHFALAPLAADIARSYDSQLHLNHPSPELLLRLIATGTLLGFFGSWLSTRRSLHKTT